MPAATELLRINLHEVTSERDPGRRRAAIDRAYADDLKFLDSEAAVEDGRPSATGAALPR